MPVSKGASPSLMPTMPLSGSAQSLLKAQPRLIVLLGIAPIALATIYAVAMKDDRGYIVAGLLLGAVTAFFAVQAILHKMKAAHWGMVVGAAVGAMWLNSGAPLRLTVLTFVAILAAAVLWLKALKDNRQRFVALLFAAVVWLGTANAPKMTTQHANAEAGMADVGVKIQDAADAVLERLTHGGG